MSGIRRRVGSALRRKSTGGSASKNRKYNVYQNRARQYGTIRSQAKKGRHKK